MEDQFAVDESAADTFLEPEPIAPAPEAIAYISIGSLGLVPRAFGDACPCPEIRFSLDESLPPDGWLDVRLQWDGTSSRGLAAQIDGPGGVVAVGERGFDAQRVKIQAAEAGEYKLRITGAGEFSGEAFTQIASAPKLDSEQRLPNIVTLVPEQIGFGPCDSVEANEQGARRCLRLGNAIGNIGDGPLEVHLTYPEAVAALAGEAVPVIDGSFTQRLYGWDGSSSDRAVGASDFHPSHAHWHYDGFAEFELYPIDPETGLRGAMAAAGHKSGFCFLDWGEMKEKETTVENGGRAEQDCLLPTESGWSMGISAGYFDFYWAGLTDQYIEATGVGDGVYELVSVADFDNWLREVREDDNAASVVIEISGDNVQVLQRRGWYDIPAGTNNL